MELKVIQDKTANDMDAELIQFDKSLMSSTTFKFAIHLYPVIIFNLIAHNVLNAL